MNSTVRDDLAFKPPFFVYAKILTLVGIFLFIHSGCSSNVHISSDIEQAAQNLDFPPEPLLSDLSITYAKSMSGADDVPIEKIRHHVAHEAILEEDSPVGTCHEGELVDAASCIMPEPKLSEDPFIEANCADSASAWCDPSHEARYLSYLQEQEFLTAQAAILPNFTSPVDKGLVLRGMQPPRKRGRRGHYGIDVIPAEWERHGVPLKAVEDGTVVISAWGRGYGYYLVVYHQNGLFSLYSHAMKKSRAQVGQELTRGDTLAYMGKSGNARGYHLHFELIDLRESWNFEESIHEFVKNIATGQPLSGERSDQFKQLLFARKTKQDPLQYITGLSYAERRKGKWVAGEAIIPASNASASAAQTR